jgi:hypothetical protein
MGWPPGVGQNKDSQPRLRKTVRDAITAREEKMAKSIHQDALIVDSLIVSDWGPDVFQSMHRGGLTAINATCAVWENFRETAENIAQ